MVRRSAGYGSATAEDPHFGSLGSVAASTAVGDRVSVKLRRFEATAATLDITPTAVDLRVPTVEIRCHRVSSSDVRSEIAYLPKHLQA